MSSDSRRSTSQQSSRENSQHTPRFTTRRVKPELSLDTSISYHFTTALNKQIFSVQPQTLEAERHIHQNNEIRDGTQEHPAPPIEAVTKQYATVSCVESSSHDDRAPYGPSISNAPVIIVTPAREDFELVLPTQKPSRRVPSSVYSRYTDLVPKSAGTDPIPPVPDLPSNINQLRRHDIPSSRAVHRGDVVNRHAAAGSVCTVFEEDCFQVPVHRNEEVTTCRHSRGWWTYLMSPFSAKSSVFPLRSPMDTESDRTPILRDVQQEPTDGGIAYNNGQYYENVADLPKSEPKASRRSITAPISSDDAVESVDIYRIPSQGEAAAYYDPNKHFPSLIITPELTKSLDDGLTEGDCTEPHSATSGAAHSCTSTKNPFIEITTYDALGASERSRTLFNTPDTVELRTPVQIPAIPHDHATSFSPLSPSPILGKAQLAQVVAKARCEPSTNATIAGPMTPAIDGKASHAAQGLGFTTMASRQADDERVIVAGLHQPRSLLHSRTSSYGLGIFGSDTDVPPYTVDLSEKQESPSRQPWYRRFLWVVLAVCTALLTLAVVLLVMHIPQGHTDVPVQAQWVNLTGFPAIVTGVTTVAQPKIVRQVDGCVQSPSMWSCDTGFGTVPDFRLEIRFKNDSSMNSSALQIHPKRSNAALARWSVRLQRLKARDTWSDDLFTAVPSPPTTSDQIFLGNTTDNNTAPFDGEPTPFYISLLNPVALSTNVSQHQKRQSVFPYPTSNTTDTSNNASDILQSIPKMLIQDDGRPSSPLLYSFAQAQPLRLFKRGQPDEHYGFYTYYDKTLFISNGTNGGSTVSNIPLANTTAVCSWAQSRLLVQIWTHGVVSELAMVNSSNSHIAINSTANNMTFPGSMPYATTITIDRHGGDAAQKGVYCYGVDQNGRLEENVKSWIDEDRSYGGTLIAPARVPWAGISSRDSNPNGGIDGGSGGCACAWQNW